MSPGTGKLALEGLKCLTFGCDVDPQDCTQALYLRAVEDPCGATMQGIVQLRSSKAA